MVLAYTNNPNSFLEIKRMIKMEIQKVMSLMKNDEKTTYPPFRSKNDFIKFRVDKVYYRFKTFW